MAKRKSYSGIGLLLKTRPFFTARVAIYGVFLFATVGFATTFLLLLSVLTYSASLQALVFLGGLAGYLLTRRYLGRTLTYQTHTPHIMAMVEAVGGTKLAKGRLQVDRASLGVDQVFPESARVFQLESLVARSIRETRSTVAPNINPFPGYTSLGKLSDFIANRASRHIQDAVLGYVLFRRHTNVWRSAYKGVTVYARSAALLTQRAIRLHLFGVLFGLSILGLALIPGWEVLAFAYDERGGLVTVLLVVSAMVKGAWLVKQTFYEPYVTARLVGSFFKELDKSENSASGDAELSQKLANVSKRFLELMDRAKAFRGGADLSPIVHSSDAPRTEKTKKNTADKSAKKEDSGSESSKQNSADQRPGGSTDAASGKNPNADDDSSQSVIIEPDAEADAEVDKTRPNTQ